MNFQSLFKLCKTIQIAQFCNGIYHQSNVRMKEYARTLTCTNADSHTKRQMRMKSPHVYATQCKMLSNVFRHNNGFVCWKCFHLTHTENLKVQPTSQSANIVILQLLRIKSKVTLFVMAFKTALKSYLKGYWAQENEQKIYVRKTKKSEGEQT